MRTPYTKFSPLNLDMSLIVRKRGGGERIIKRGKWWINKNTPVGEDAEIWEEKPWGGRKLIEFSEIIATEIEEAKT